MQKLLLGLVGVSLFAADLKVTCKVAPGSKANVETPVVITVRDAKDMPISGADVEAILTMVDMDHGEFKYKATPARQGLYRANVKFLMPGAWQVRVQAKKGSDSGAQTTKVAVE